MENGAHDKMRLTLDELKYSFKLAIILRQYAKVFDCHKTFDEKLKHFNLELEKCCLCDRLIAGPQNSMWPGL